MHIDEVLAAQEAWLGNHTCPRCRSTSPATRVSCPNCGAPVSVPIKKIRKSTVENIKADEETQTAK